MLIGNQLIKCNQMNDLIDSIVKQCLIELDCHAIDFDFDYNIQLTLSPPVQVTLL